MQNLIGLAVAAFWIIFSTVAAPVIIQVSSPSGTQAGGEPCWPAASAAFLQTAATTAGAAATAAPIGIPAVTAGAAGVAALLGTTLPSAANMGSAGAIIIAGLGLPPRSARGRPGDDITGNKAVRELIAKSKPNYY